MCIQILLLSSSSLILPARLNAIIIQRQVLTEDQPKEKTVNPFLEQLKDNSGRTSGASTYSDLRLVDNTNHK